LQPTNLSYVDIRCSDHNHAYTSFLCWSRERYNVAFGIHLVWFALDNNI
jgi:hypothetical protein